MCRQSLMALSRGRMEILIWFLFLHCNRSLMPCCSGKLIIINWYPPLLQVFYWFFLITEKSLIFSRLRRTVVNFIFKNRILPKMPSQSLSNRAGSLGLGICLGRLSCLSNGNRGPIEWSDFVIVDCQINWTYIWVSDKMGSFKVFHVRRIEVFHGSMLC